MDSEQFDGLVRCFGQARSRRQTLRGMGAAALGAVGFARAGTVGVAADPVRSNVSRTRLGTERYCNRAPCSSKNRKSSTFQRPPSSANR